MRKVIVEFFRYSLAVPFVVIMVIGCVSIFIVCCTQPTVKPVPPTRPLLVICATTRDNRPPELSSRIFFHGNAPVGRDQIHALATRRFQAQWCTEPIDFTVNFGFSSPLFELEISGQELLTVEIRYTPVPAPGQSLFLAREGLLPGRDGLFRAVLEYSTPGPSIPILHLRPTHHPQFLLPH